MATPSLGQAKSLPVLSTVEQVRAFVSGTDQVMSSAMRMPLPVDIAPNAVGFWYQPPQPLAPLVTAVFVSSQSRELISLVPAPGSAPIECHIVRDEVCIGVRGVLEDAPVLLDAQHHFLPPRCIAGSVFAGFVYAVI